MCPAPCRRSQGTKSLSEIDTDNVHPQLPVPSWVEQGDGYNLIAPLGGRWHQSVFLRIALSVAVGVGGIGLLVVLPQVLVAYGTLASMNWLPIIVFMFILLITKQPYAMINLRHHQLEVRGDRLRMETFVGGFTEGTTKFPLASLREVKRHHIVHNDGHATPLLGFRPSAEMDAVLALINEAIEAHRSDATPNTPAKRVPWGLPPKQHHAPNTPMMSLPDWVQQQGLHDTTFEARLPQARGIASFAAIFTIGLLAMIGGLAAVLVAMGKPLWMLVGAVAVFLLSTPILMFLVGYRQGVHADQKGVRITTHVGPLTLGTRHLPATQVLGVSACDGSLLFHLGDRVHQQRCFKPSPEVQALATHLHRLVTQSPSRDVPAPPEDLVRMVKRRSVPESS